MVAIALGLIILAGLAVVFANTSAARKELESTSRQIENGRYAVKVLSDDLRVAGFFGELSPAGAKPAIAIPASVPDPCSATAADWTPALYFPVQGFSASNGSLSCLLSAYNYKAGTDVLIVRRAKTCAAGVSGCTAATGGKGYIQVSLCGDEVPTTTHKLGLQGTESFDLKQKDCGGTTAVRRQYLVHIYFISTDNGSGVNVPTLKLLELCGGDDTSVTCATSPAWTVTPIVEGIEQIRFQYGMDYMDSGGNGNADAVPDAYTFDPSAFPTEPDDPADPAGCTGAPACSFTAVNNWMNVVSVRFSVLARNPDPSPGYTDSKCYNLGPRADGTQYTVGTAASCGATPDVTLAGGDLNYRRHVYYSLVRLVNPAGRRDTP